jgi:Trk K+ transport system NAD-binding subunit
MPHRAIVVSGGPTGSRAAATLGDYGYDPVVIEQDADRREQLHAPDRAVLLDGDATRPDVPDRADPERADLFAALAGSPESNRALRRRVKRRTGGVRAVVGGTPAGGGRNTTGAVDGTVQLPGAGANAVGRAALGYDQAVRSAPTSGVDLLRLGVDPRTPAASRESSDVAFPSGRTVAVDVEATETVGPDTELRPDRQYLFGVAPTAADTVRNLLEGAR